MRDPGVGRVLVASLHQAVTEVLPTRLGFYENWLNAEGMREGTMGIAALYAVLSFLRQEGHTYDSIVARAGECAADWTVQSMSPLRRSFIKAMPAWLRGRLLLRLARQLVRNTFQGSVATSRVRRGTARVDLRDSIFCTVREHVARPLCGFYAAAFARLLSLFGLQARVEVVDCRGTGKPICVLTVALADAGKARRPEAA